MPLFLLYFPLAYILYVILFRVSLLFSRYALDHGATAVAVDVENITNLQNGTHNSGFVFSEHTVQRRPESLSLKHGQNGELSGM